MNTVITIFFLCMFLFFGVGLVFVAYSLVTSLHSKISMIARREEEFYKEHGRDMTLDDWR